MAILLVCLNSSILEMDQVHYVMVMAFPTIPLGLALLLGVIAGLVSFVPYLGLIVGILLAGLAAFFQFGGWLPVLQVAIVFAVAQAIEGMVLTPRFVGERIGLHPVAVIFAV